MTWFPFAPASINTPWSRLPAIPLWVSAGTPPIVLFVADAISTPTPLPKPSSTDGEMLMLGFGKARYFPR